MGLTPPREREIQKAILTYLLARGITAWRVNTGAVTAQYQGRERFVRFSPKGHSDILAILPPGGRVMALEVKRPGGKLSLEQDAFLRLIARQGGIGAMVTCCADVDALLQRHVQES